MYSFLPVFLSSCLPSILPFGLQPFLPSFLLVFMPSCLSFLCFCKYADFRTRKMVAGGIVQSKLKYLFTLFGAAPAYLLLGLQVQQMAAARAVVGLQSRQWSNSRTLNFLGWLKISQQYTASILILTHKIVTTRRPENIHKSMVLSFPYPTRRGTEQKIWTWAGTIKGQHWTVIFMRTFKWR